MLIGLPYLIEYVNLLEKKRIKFPASKEKNPTSQNKTTHS